MRRNWSALKLFQLPAPIGPWKPTSPAWASTALSRAVMSE